MIGLIILPFIYIFSYLIYKDVFKWLCIIFKCFNNKVIKTFIFIVYLFVNLSILIAFLLPNGDIKRIFQFIGNLWLGTIIFAIIIYLVALIIKKIFHKKILIRNTDKIYTIFGLVCVIILFLTVIYGTINARIIKTTNYDVTIHKKAKLKELNIAMVADFHIGYNINNKQISKMVDKINKSKPDIVFIVGDIFDNEYDAIEDPDELISILKKIKSKYGVFAVYGNHDIEEKTLMGFTFNSKKKKESSLKMDELVKKANIKLLRDEYVLINDSFYVYGRPDASKLGRGIKKRKSINDITDKIDKTKPIILLDHQPQELDQLSNNKIDLDLSGHTHDGQIFPLKYFIKIKYKNSLGMKKYGNSTSIVTSGIGVYGPYMRVFTIAEIVNIKVKFKHVSIDNI